MENWTVKSVDGVEQKSAAEREEAVQEAHAPEQAEPQQEETTIPTNEDGDYVVNLDNPIITPEEDAIQERETEEVPVDEPSGDSGEVEQEVSEQPKQEVADEAPDAEFGIELVEEDEPAQEEAKVEEPAVHNGGVEEPAQEEAPSIELPEGVDKLVQFMNETGGTVEDYINLNKDVESMQPVDTIREYYKKKYPHYDAARIERKLNKSFAYDQEVDDPDVIQDKQDAFQDELFAAQEFLRSNKEKYYADLKANPRNQDPKVQEALTFYNEQSKQREESEKLQQNFHKLTDDVFNDDFKGFDFKVGEKKFRVKVGDVGKTKDAQKDLNNFVNQYLDDNGNIKNVTQYHKALYAARNVDKLAQHFYEQGRADAIKTNAAKAKNIDMQPRQDAASVVTPSGSKYRVVSGDSGSKLRIKMVSAEMPMSSDQVIWTEQGRLHTRLTGLYGNVANITSAKSASVALAASSNGGATISYAAAAYEGGGDIPFKVGQTVMIGKQDGVDATTGNVAKGVITAISAFGFTATLYGSHDAIAAGDTFTALVYGSEFAKGTGNFDTKIDPEYSTYDNAPIIMKEHYSLYGSDATQIGWIEVTSENGASGYLWYVKAEHENRLRWEDHQEMTMLEAIKQDGTGALLGLFRDDVDGQGGPSEANRRARGTEGFFSALDDRGNQYDGLIDDLAVGGRNGLAAFDNILKTLDKNGAIEENMLYVNRDLALEFDNLLASQSDYTQNGGGASWGVFNNSKDMALDLGFSGFRRGSYDFYKSDWKYLNDFATRGGFSDIEGVMIPAGTSTVYDQTLGKNIKRPFLHVRYRASETENRKNKSWITGSVGGAYTTDIDELRLHYLTERCLITQGANNFFKFNG